MARPSSPALIPARWRPSLAALVGLLGPTAAAQSIDANWVEQLHPSFGVELAHVENISRTSFEPTRKDATTVAVDLAGSIPRQLAPSVLFIGSGEVSSLFV